MNLLIAPAGSGKTTYLMDLARASTKKNKRVWWVGLPSQRNHIYRKATEKGSLLGLEFLSQQQVYYRLLAAAQKLQPLLVGTGRVALVGQALLNYHNELPSPGEARLFTQAIAEAKRFGLNYDELEPKDDESERFKLIFREYERLKDKQWDYDDFRSETLNLLSSKEFTLEADLIIVDGFREIGPLELDIYKALAQSIELWLSLPECPPHSKATKSLDNSHNEIELESYRATNPINEARWVLRSLKRDLAKGFSPLDLAVVMPQRNVKAFLSLADEYDLPIMNEVPKALADTAGGALLLDLLELPDYPTASKLLAIPELQGLAQEALKQGVAGREALTVLAKELSLEKVWQKWLKDLEIQDGEPLAWAEQTVTRIIPEILGDSLPKNWLEHSQLMLERAKEASFIGKEGIHFRAWWAGLIQETFPFEKPLGGIALLNAKLVSGRRFKKVYLIHAIESSYTVGEHEDYFLTEEHRKPLKEVFASFGLPKRFLGRNDLLFKELLTRGDEIIVTYPEADQGGPLVRELALTGKETPPRLPNVPAGSYLELSGQASYEADFSKLKFDEVTIEKLRLFDKCAFKFWAEDLLETKEKYPWWLSLLNDLRKLKQLNKARLEILKSDYPEAALWLNEYSSELLKLSFGIYLPEKSDPKAFVDAALRKGPEIDLFKFTAPENISDSKEAEDYFNNRWNELWATGHLLQGYQGKVKKVRLFVWNILGEPVEAFNGIDFIWRRILTKQRKVKESFRQFSQGDVLPKPGFICRECSVFDMCRKGQR